MKSAVLTGVALALASVGLVGCQQASEQPSSEQTQAAPDGPAGIAVSQGRLVLPPVKGNPAAVYFEIANNGEADTQIVGVAVDGAQSAMLHETVQSDGISSMHHRDAVPLTKGSTVPFAPGGYHVMAMNLSDDLQAGGSTEVTLTFANGDKVSFPVEIRSPGDAG